MGRFWGWNTLTDVVDEVLGRRDDLADDLSSTHVLAVHHRLSDIFPLAVSALRDLVFTDTDILLDLFTELEDKLIDSVLVLIVDEHFKHATCLDLLHTVVIKRVLFIFLVALLELFSFLVKCLLELLSELSRDFGRNSIEGESLLREHIIIDVFDFSDETGAG